MQATHENYLILDQGDKRGDYNGDSLVQERRQLVAQALACTHA